MKSPQLAPELIIFDLDGTLIDTLEDIKNAVNFALTQLGKSHIDAKATRSYVGDGVRRLMELVLKSYTENEISESLKHFEAHYHANLITKTQPFDGVVEILEQLSKIPKVVLTNKPEGYAKEILDALNLSQYFLETVGNKPEIKAKPDPEGILILLKNHQANPQKTLMIGDSDHDIHAGKAAGVKTCAVTYGFRDAELLKSQSPDYLVNTPLELLNLFDNDILTR